MGRAQFIVTDRLEGSFCYHIVQPNMMDEIIITFRGERHPHVHVRFNNEPAAMLSYVFRMVFLNIIIILRERQTYFEFFVHSFHTT